MYNLRDLWEFFEHPCLLLRSFQTAMYSKNFGVIEEYYTKLTYHNSTGVPKYLFHINCGSWWYFSLYILAMSTLLDCRMKTGVRIQQQLQGTLPTRVALWRKWVCGRLRRKLGLASLVAAMLDLSLLASSPLPLLLVLYSCLYCPK